MSQLNIVSPNIQLFTYINLNLWRTIALSYFIKIRIERERVFYNLK